jgi:hypothetical protein
MTVSREPLAARAAQVATALVELLDRGQTVAGFVDRYARQYDRAGLKASPLRHRELLVTLRRECLLAMATRLQAELPRMLVGGRAPVLRGASAEAADAFQGEFCASLAAELKWSPAELEDFRHDLALYARLSPPTAPPRRGAAPREGPFVDRAALLLDPALLDRARKAAGEFLGELEDAAANTAQRIFRERPAAASSRKRKGPRR